MKTPAASKEQPPRPPNCFLLYRADKLPELKDTLKRQGDLSKALGDMWNKESPAVRAAYKRKADRAAEEHRSLYPDYQFRPKRKGKKIQEFIDSTEKNRTNYLMSFLFVNN